MNRPIIQSTVRTRVKKLKCLNVSTITSQGFVNAFVLPETNKAGRFSIVNGKNYDKMWVTLNSAMRAVPNTMLAWTLPGKLSNILLT